jgi:very-short-patch-repair endonuclease
MAQKDAVLIQVEAMRRMYPEMDTFFKRHECSEEFFIKNLENVQGDERDVIFISIGYGKTAQGTLSTNFGPINKEGGERRLNVLISRSKQGMVVFSNFTGDELSTGIESPFGIKALKEFLLFAEKRQPSVPIETGREMDSPFEMAVCQAIIGLGYDVEPQVGTQGFYIDLAIRDPRKPGRYLLAVECDGASYHSSANARDRDRLRQSVLEGLGWKFHRIWSTDWFRNAKQETQRLKECIENILKEAVNDAVVDQNVILGTLQECDSNNISENPQIERIKIEAAEQQITEEYFAVNLNLLYDWTIYQDFSEIPTQKMHEAIIKVLEKESPISKKVLTIRLIGAVCLSRAGNRIQTRVEEDVKFLSLQKLCEIKGDFIWRSGQTEIKVRNRSSLPAAEKKLELIAPEEIRLAFEQTIEEAMTITISDCIAEVSNRLGFHRTTIQMREIFENEFKCLQNSKKIIFDGDIIRSAL